MVNRSGHDVMAVLCKEHDAFRDLLDRLDRVEGDAAAVLLRRLHDQVVVHAQVEDEVVYPAFTGLLDDEEAERFVEDSRRDHEFIDGLLRELTSVPRGSVSFGEDLLLLRETLEYHLNEEEDTFFPRLARACSEALLVELGQRVQQRQQALRRQQRRRRAQIVETVVEHRTPGLSKTELIQRLRQK